MSREVPFEPDAICDACGVTGAYDLMGDHLCPSCLAKTPIIRDPAIHGGDPVIQGTGLRIPRLLVHAIWAFEEEAKEHPGTPYALDCVVRRASRAYCEDYPYVSFSQAEQAIGYAVLRLFQLSLRRQATVLNKAFEVSQ